MAKGFSIDSKLHLQHSASEVIESDFPLALQIIVNKKIVSPPHQHVDITVAVQSNGIKIAGAGSRSGDGSLIPSTGKGLMS